MEPEFLVDDTILKKEEELEQTKRELEFLLKRLKTNPKIVKNAMLLRAITRGAIYSFKKPKIIKQPVIKQPVTQSPITKETKQIKIPIPIKPIKQPIKKTKTELPKIEQKNLITDRFTKQVLATANVSNTYEVTQPDLDENDLKALNKVIKKYPKEIKKAWELIQKYSKKFKVQEGHDNNIKYYVINRFFAFGKLEPLMHDKDITKIILKGINTPITITYKGKQLQTNISFQTKEQLITFLDILAQRTKQKLDKNNTTLNTQYRGFNITARFANENSEVVLNRI